MNFTLSVHKQIMESPVGSSRPEQGGALFSSDGGVTVDKFIFDEKGSRSGTTYSPNVKFINEQIRYWSGRGYYFIGFVHSHPQGFTAISTGRGGGYGYTVSDEDAIVKLLGGMKGTRRLYFPVVQSSVYGKFSMRVFCGEKDLSGSVKIWEDRNIHIVEDVSGNCVRRELRAYLPMDRYSHSTAIIVGAGGGADLAEWLTRAGVNKFILLDSTRYEYSDLSGGAFFRDIGGYKADAVARRIHAINPASRVKIIRQHIDNDIKIDDFRFWLDNVDRRKSLVIFCEGGKDDFNILKGLCSACGIALIRSYAYPGYQPVAQYVHTEFYDFWANSCANAKCEVDHIGGLYGVNPLNTALFGKVNAFFSCPTGKKERKDIARSEEVKPLSVEKYEPLYCKAEIERKKVVIVGCGGSRSYAENLARSGIKHFVLIDADAYGRSNLQTQMAYADELGSRKAEVIADRIRLIAPDADVTVVNAMLDENMTDERFAAFIGEEWLADPYSVLLAACTDNVIAQERCSRLALKYGFPFLMAGIYPGGRVLEIAFFHPAVSTVCPRCMFNKRIEANLSVRNRPAPAVSNGTSVFITEQLNAYKGFISLSLLLYHSETADKRFSEFMDDNQWRTPKRKRKLDRNFLFLTMDSRMEEHSGRKAYAQFDRWGRMCGSNFQIGGAFFRKKKPLKHCPDCGGIGTPLIRVKGTIADTREGLYPKEEIQ